MGSVRTPAGELEPILKGIAARPQVADLLADWTSLMAVCATSARVVAIAASEGRPPLAYRGAVAFGDVLSSGRFVIGPAVDEAAEGEKMADAALVWLLPSAAAVLDRLVEAMEVSPDGWDMPRAFIRNLLLTDYSIPLKMGRSLRTYAVNPLFGETDDSVVAHLLEAFRTSSAVDVVYKRQNTESFLQRARDEWGASRARLLAAAVEAVSKDQR